MGTAHALEIARNIADLRAMVVVTTDKCYRNDNRLTGYREEDPLGGNDPYSCSKTCAELVTESYRKSFFTGRNCAVATARAGNVLGGGDWSRDRLVPDVVRALGDGSMLRLRNSTATRPWQHVLDPLSGYLMLAERLCAAGDGFAEAWNFGPSDSDSITVEGLVELIFAAWHAEPRWERDTEPNPPESQRLALDATKAREKLGWEPRLSNSETIRWTVQWYKEWYSGRIPDEITSVQIERYQDMLREGDSQRHAGRHAVADSRRDGPS
jgi:CDP-glucose 4,6-dehydratase